MAVAQCFRLASPNVVSETVEGEAVILNLETGLYYGLTGVRPCSGTRCETAPTSTSSPMP